MANVVDNYCDIPAVFRRPMWRVWHKLLIQFDKDSTVNFMNYGFEKINGEKVPELKKEDEINRFCIQLYDHVVNSIELKDKKVVEIGSGRGGGAHYISKYFKPESYTGVDISTSVIAFCNKYYQVPGLSFVHGRAEKIPIQSASVDVVVNVESARCYSDMNVFFDEVYRILKPDGYFLFADMVGTGEIHGIRQKLDNSGFNLEKEQDITSNVAKDLEMDTRRREALIQNKIPSLMKKSFKRFAGVKGTDRFNSFKNGKYEYWSFVLSKK
jgi:ubiquinone/menaquinone biosynthesis C-methylase UbiE